MDGKEKSESNNDVGALFDQIAVDYEDVYLQSIEAKIFGFVAWTHLTQFLPKDRDARILDAGGGTGRWTLPLAKMGYRVVLCDISRGMLSQAEKRLRQEGLLDRVEVKVEDIACLSFEDESFDFVMCEDGPLSITPDFETAAKELVRVLKQKGTISTGGLGRYPLVLREIKDDPEIALKLARGDHNYVEYKGTPNRVFTPRELEKLFLKNGVTIEKMYGYRIATQVFPPDYEVKEGRMIKTGPTYDAIFINHAAQAELLLSEDPSLLGMAGWIQLVGKKL